jgi:hypothetical protein
VTRPPVEYIVDSIIVFREGELEYKLYKNK